jgi:hypothetical protein
MWCATKDYKRPTFLGSQNGTFVPPPRTSTSSSTMTMTTTGSSVPTATASASTTGSGSGVPGMAGGRFGGGMWAGMGVGVVAALATLIL